MEVAGVEPASEDKTLKTSPYRVCLVPIRLRVLRTDMIPRKLDRVFKFSGLRPVREPRA